MALFSVALTGLSAPAGAAGATVTVGASSVAAGSPITATWSDIVSPTATDWVGLYPTGTTDSSVYDTYAYTDGAAAGSVDVVIPAGSPSGSTYELRLFANDSYSLLATSGSFTVSGTTSSTTLSASPGTITTGSPVTATWAGIGSPTARDWVALYPTGATSSSTFDVWAYTNGAANGTLNLTVPAGTAPGATYELRLFSNNSYSLLATSAAFTVEDGSVAFSTATAAEAPALKRASLPRLVVPSKTVSKDKGRKL